MEIAFCNFLAVSDSATCPDIGTRCRLYRSSLSGIVPSQLKIAKVNSIFKSGDNQEFSNYRLIPILPSISKILEKILYPPL